MQKPFLKWVGGKTQLLETILENIPRDIENYYEAFLGGGSVLLAILSLRKDGIIKISGNIYANDLNSFLIQVYIDIRDSPEKIFQYITKYTDEYNSIQKSKGDRNATTREEALVSKESYYYWIRNKYNSICKCIEKSALFMFLNRTCFRGIYREGPNGFNVPFGNYENKLEIISENNLYIVSELMKDVIFSSNSFEKILDKVGVNDFVYLDPPYAPENNNSFVGYTKDGFNIEMHKKLFAMTKNLQSKFMLSNSKVKIVMDEFDGYIIEDVKARRAINSKNPSAVTTEVFVSNYFILKE